MLSSKVRGALCIALLLLTAGVAGVRACDLPLDPFVVGLPSGRTSFDGWIKVPGSAKAGGNYNIDGWMGYIRTTASTPLSWKLFWDPTNGAQNMKQLKIVNPALVAPGMSQFPIRYNGSAETKVALFDLDQASTILMAAMGGNPMKLEEVYNRDPTSTGPWSTEKFRASAPWEIPAGNFIWNPEPPVKFAPTIVSTGTTHLSAINVLTSGSSEADKSQFLTDCFTADWSPDPPATPLTYVKGWSSGLSGTNFWRLSVDPSDAAHPRPQWTGVGGTWTFSGVNGFWKMDTEDTADQPGVNEGAGLGLPGTQIAGFSFVTPSAPYFYRVKPKGELIFDLAMAGGDKYEWWEERVEVDATGNVTPNLGWEQKSLVASGQIKKQGAKYDGGVSTAVIVDDVRAPHHVHLKSGFSYTAVGGATPTGTPAEYVMVDDNPYGATTAAEFSTQQATTTPVGPAFGAFNPANMTAEFYYSFPVSEYGLSDLSKILPTLPNDFALDASGQFPFHFEKWVWAKKPVATPTTFFKPFADGAGVQGPGPTTPFGNGANPYFSMVKWTVDVGALWTDPVSIHHVTATVESNYAHAKLPAGPKAKPTVSYLAGTEKRLKFFLAPKDAMAKAAYSSTADFDASIGGTDSEAAGLESVKASAEHAVFNNTGTAIPPASVPTMNYAAAVAANASACGAPTCVPGAVGNFGYVDTITEDVRAKVILLVKDTKFDRTYIFNDQTQGEWRHPAAVAALIGAAVPGTRQTATDNSAVVPLIGGGDPMDIDFSAGGTDPNEFIPQVNPAWKPFDRPSVTRTGLWVDEDTSLIFRMVSWDNTNWETQFAASDFDWSIEDGPKGGTVPKGDLPIDGQGRFQYTFRDPNKGPDALAGNCKVTIEGPQSLPSTQRRKLTVSFFVLSNKLKILTLEESRRNK